MGSRTRKEEMKEGRAATEAIENGTLVPGKRHCRFFLSRFSVQILYRTQTVVWTGMGLSLSCAEKVCLLFHSTRAKYVQVVGSVSQGLRRMPVVVVGVLCCDLFCSWHSVPKRRVCIDEELYQRLEERKMGVRVMRTD